MAPNRLKLGMIFVFITGLVALFIQANINRPRLLILHSYDTSYSWTRDVNTGLHRVLDPYTHFAIRWHYMDTKRHPDADFKRVAGNGARRAIEQWQPRVLIAIDDDAQAFAAKYFVNHPRIHILFAGINGGTDPYGYPGARNATGILERKPLRAIQEAAQLVGSARQRPGALRILHLADRSGSVKEDAAFMDHHDWRPLQFVGSRLADDFEEWQALVRQAPRETDLILLSNYRKLARSAMDPSLVPSGEVMSWTVANTQLPLLGSNLFNVEDGADLAVGVSPFEQGEVVAGMALDILERGRSPRDIPVRSTQQFIVSLREQRLAAGGIRLPSVYEAFARATNNFHAAGDGTQIPVSGAPPVAAEAPPALPAPVPVTAPAREPAATPARLEIQARQPSWVEVRDATGKRLTAGTRPAGSRLEVAGAPPLAVTLGKPDGVSLKFNGRPVDPEVSRGQSFTLK